jgi:hypothetical protein
MWATGASAFGDAGASAYGGGGGFVPSSQDSGAGVTEKKVIFLPDGPEIQLQFLSFHG